MAFLAILIVKIPFLKLALIDSASTSAGKLKTVVYIVAEFYGIFLELLVRLELVPDFFGAMQIGAFALFAICVILSYASFIDYLIHFGKILKDI